MGARDNLFIRFVMLCMALALFAASIGALITVADDHSNRSEGSSDTPVGERLLDSAEELARGIGLYF